MNNLFILSKKLSSEKNTVLSLGLYNPIKITFINQSLEILKKPLIIVKPMIHGFSS